MLGRQRVIIVREQSDGVAVARYPHLAPDWPISHISGAADASRGTPVRHPCQQRRTSACASIEPLIDVSSSAPAQVSRPASRSARWLQQRAQRPQVCRGSTRAPKQHPLPAGRANGCQLHLVRHERLGYQLEQPQDSDRSVVWPLRRRLLSAGSIQPTNTNHHQPGHSGCPYRPCRSDTHRPRALGPRRRPAADRHEDRCDGDRLRVAHQRPDRGGRARQPARARQGWRVHAIRRVHH